MNNLSNSALRAQLGNSLRQLQIALGDLSEHVKSQARDAWIWHQSDAGALAFSRPPTDLSRTQTLERIAAGIQAIKYEAAQDSHESRIWPGVVMVAHEGVALADEVNRHKASLAQTLKSMEGRTEAGTIDQRTGEPGLRPLREVALEAFYFRRLHHWQAVRRLEVLRENPDDLTPPEYIGFMWANSRDVRRTSREELIKEADTRDGLLLTPLDLEALDTLPVGEPLAVVRPGHTSAKANIRWPARAGLKGVAKVRTAVLPFISFGERLPARLRRLPPVPTPKHFRLSRTDTEIEPTPLLPNLPIHRYLEQFRESKRGA